MPSAGSTILESVLRTLEAMPPLLGFFTLFLASVIEYVFPPFPGDTVVVAGAGLVAAFGWPLWPVFAAVTAGSVAGSIIAWSAGRAVARREKRLGRVPGELEGRVEASREVEGDRNVTRSPEAGSKAGEGLDGRARLAVYKLVAGFERHGAWFLVLNRFMPGVRTFFFVAAGMVDLPLRVVLFWSTISSAIWNGALIWLGLTAAENVEELESLVGRYNSLVVPIVVGVTAVVVWRTWRGTRGRTA